MPYARVDDQEWSAPWVTMAGNAAYGALNRMRGYCAAHQTDGDLPEGIAVLCAGADGYAALDALERVGKLVWIDPAEGLNGAHADRIGQRIARLAGWLDHNIKNEDWEALKHKRSAAGRKAAKARWGAK